MILELKANPSGAIDMSPVHPSACLDKKPAEVAAIALRSETEQQQTLGDLFDIQCDEPEKLVIRNSGGLLDYVGAEMNSGEMLVEGDAGNFSARNMSGGVLQINGSVGHHAASSMKGGMLKISGDSGNFLGGAGNGMMQGIAGGTVIVKGNSGHRVGDRMRKGLIVIQGDTGECCASRMIAGTIVMLGQIGPRLGLMMRRGSLVTTPDIAVDEKFFSEESHQKIDFLTLLIKHLHTLDERLAKIPITDEARYHRGDMSVAGTGEILKIPL